jgi:hypothetical protein
MSYGKLRLKETSPATARKGAGGAAVERWVGPFMSHHWTVFTIRSDRFEGHPKRIQKTEGLHWYVRCHSSRSIDATMKFRDFRPHARVQMHILQAARVLAPWIDRLEWQC